MYICVYVHTLRPYICSPLGCIGHRGASGELPSVLFIYSWCGDKVRVVVTMTLTPPSLRTLQ